MEFNTSSTWIVIAAVVVILLLFMRNQRSERFDSLPFLPKYIPIATDGQNAYYRGGGLYYGVPPNKMVFISEEKMFNAGISPMGSNKFTCLPSGFSPVNGAPVLPINDPVPNVKKTCMALPPRA